MSAKPDIVTAAVLVIGDEILSGRTKDRNIGYIADYLTAIGIDLKEVRIVSDDGPAIVEAVNGLRAKYTYVFTTGGSGATPSEITPDRRAGALGGWGQSGGNAGPSRAANSMKRACAWPVFRPAPRGSRTRCLVLPVSGSAMSSKWPAFPP